MTPTHAPDRPTPATAPRRARRAASRLAAVAGAALGALGLLVAGAGGAAAHGAGPGAGYAVAALGDSYASGEGAPLPGPRPWQVDAWGDSGADGCHRSAIGGHRVAGLLLAPWRAVDVACSGATTADVVTGSKGERSQLDALGPATRVVTLSAGGNDIGFGATASACAGAGAASSACAQAAAAVPAAIAALPPKLVALYAQIHRRAPHARLYVTGYPRLFPAPPVADPSCGTTPQVQAEFTRLGDALDQVIAGAAARGGATYVDLVGPFTGHASCGVPVDQRWINALTSQGPQPADPAQLLHPNAAGQVAIAGALLASVYRTA